MAKSADAFRTISEVADWLEVPAHVLRFWESKFSHVKPVKRAGGRRYYRPGDMQLLGGIKTLLHDDGMTIKGVQKLLREKGLRHVAGHSQPLDDVTAAEISEIALDVKPDPVEPSPAQVLNFQRSPKPDPVQPATPASGTGTPASPPAEIAPEPEPQPEPTAEEPPAKVATAPPEEPATPVGTSSDSIPPEDPDSVEAPPEAGLPSFMHRHTEPPADASDGISPAAPPDDPPPPADPVPAPPAPAKITVPDDPEDDLPADAGILTQLANLARPVPRDCANPLSAIANRLQGIGSGGSTDRNTRD